MVPAPPLSAKLRCHGCNPRVSWHGANCAHPLTYRCPIPIPARIEQLDELHHTLEATTKSMSSMHDWTEEIKFDLVRDCLGYNEQHTAAWPQLQPLV